MGYPITSFETFKQALPLITLTVSMISSSLGMTKFFLHGPIPLLPKDSLMNGLVSLPFISMLLINCMFGVRVLCIESAFFSSYQYERGYYGRTDFFQKTIDPIFPTEYRILAYLTPSFISFMINILKLLYTGSQFTKYVKKYPQILFACCFTPFMFEGCNINSKSSIRVWKLGTVLNALFIGCLPQLILISMDFYRGVVYWDFLGLILSQEQVYENNDALFKVNYGNIWFSIITGMLFLFLIIFLFFTNIIFKTHGIYCKCCCILCLPCPQNCINTSQELLPSHSLEITITHKIEEDENVLTANNSEIKDGIVCRNKLLIYCNGDALWTTEKSSGKEKIELKQVKSLCGIYISQ